MTDAPPAGAAARPYADHVVHYAQPVVLYRYLDAKGEMLYIGISSDPARRWEEHVERSVWAKYAAQLTFWVYPDRAAALRAERQAIKHDNPVFNSARPGVRSSGTARQERYLRTGNGGGYRQARCRDEANSFCFVCGPDGDRWLDDSWNRYLKERAR